MTDTKVLSIDEGVEMGKIFSPGDKFVLYMKQEGFAIGPYECIETNADATMTGRDLKTGAMGSFYMRSCIRLLD